MVNIAYIHAKDEEYSVALESKTNNDFFESCIEDMNLLQKRYENNKMFVESDVYTNDVIMEGAKEIITKFGEKIRKIIDACINFVKQKVEAFQKFLWDRKDKTKVLEKLVAENPEKASKLELMIDSGKISYTDFRSISDFYKNIDEVMKEIEKGDAKSAKGKLEKAKDNIEKAANIVIGTATVVTAITTISMGAGKLISSLKNKKNDTDIDFVYGKTKELEEYKEKKHMEFQEFIGPHTQSEIRAMDKLMRTNMTTSVDKEGKRSITYRRESVEDFFESGDSTPQELMSVYSATVSTYDKYSRKFINDMTRARANLYNIADKAINKLKGGTTQ